jgi:hypothetical protein
MGLYLLTSLKWNLSLIYCDDISIEVIPPRNHYAVTVFSPAHIDSSIS